MILEASFDEIQTNLVVLQTSANENYNLKDGDFVRFSFVCDENKIFIFKILINDFDPTFQKLFIFPKWIENYFKLKKNEKNFYCSFKKIPETNTQIDLEKINKDHLNIEIDFISILEQDKLINYSAFLLKYQVKIKKIKFHSNRLI